MEKILFRADTRGFADHGWLQARHTFSFADYYNPSRIGFGLLRVFNDDRVAPSAGFGAHSHENMEIVTIPLSGSLRHQDSMGNGQVISQGEVQRMSAGTGITHSEHNPSDTDGVNLLQIWVYPKKRNIPPGYDQKRFDSKDRDNRFQLIVSPDGKDDSIWINQDAFFSLAMVGGGRELDYEIHKKGNGLYVFVISGSIAIAGEKLNRRDALAVSDPGKVSLAADEDSEVLAIEVPMS